MGKALPKHLQNVHWLPRSWYPVEVGFAPSREAREKYRQEFNAKSAWPGVESTGRCEIMRDKVQGGAVILIALSPLLTDPLEIVLTLAHEAVHGFQYVCDYVGEHKPGAEAQAYGIEQILKGLIEAYRETLGKGKEWPL